MTYLMFCSFLAPTTPAPTFPPELMGLPIAGGNHEGISVIEHASEPGSTALASSGAPGNFVVGHAGDDMDVDTNLGSDAVDGDSEFGQRLMRGRCKSAKWLVTVQRADETPSGLPRVVELELTDWSGNPCKESWSRARGRPTSAKCSLCGKPRRDGHYLILVILREKRDTNRAG
jgi:hypothetical protein